MRPAQILLALVGFCGKGLAVPLGKTEQGRPEMSIAVRRDHSQLGEKWTRNEDEPGVFWKRDEEEPESPCKRDENELEVK